MEHSDLQKFPSAKCQLLKKVFSRVPSGDAVGFLNIFWLGPLQYCPNVLLWVPDLLYLNLCEEGEEKQRKIEIQSCNLSVTGTACMLNLGSGEKRIRVIRIRAGGGIF